MPEPKTLEQKIRYELCRFAIEVEGTQWDAASDLEDDEYSDYQLDFINGVLKNIMKIIEEDKEKNQPEKNHDTK